ncbi:hypothetical protein GCM10009804_03170 [Kribbella hippodromi]|uniref:Uncharacterized protein n=1 Tax=Kribbella hippodromi TaxID=434347 RepID=A0ABN2C291_9ACTN
MITLKVTPDGGEPYTVTATSRDVLMWEKTTQGNKSFVDLVNAPNLIDLYKVAHLASQRQGLFPGSYQDFEASCEVDGETEDDPEPDPTQSAASTADSSSSPSEQASAPRSGRTKANGR